MPDYEWARGTDISSAQFLFDPAEFAYIRNHWVFLDHDQRFTGSSGVSYSWEDWKVAIDAFMAMVCARVLPTRKRAILTRPLISVLQRRIKLTEKTAITVRFDVTNIFDKIYELRDGSGIGVGAPQFGQRRGFYGTVAFDF